MFEELNLNLITLTSLTFNQYLLMTHRTSLLIGTMHHLFRVTKRNSFPTYFLFNLIPGCFNANEFPESNPLLVADPGFSRGRHQLPKWVC